MLEEWRSHHPAPSWMLVADDLYCGRSGDKYGKYHEVLQQVKVKYLKGKKIITLANLMVSLKYAHWKYMYCNCTEHPLQGEGDLENIPTFYPSNKSMILFTIKMGVFSCVILWSVAVDAIKNFVVIENVWYLNLGDNCFHGSLLYKKNMVDPVPWKPLFYAKFLWLPLQHSRVQYVVYHK